MLAKPPVTRQSLGRSKEGLEGAPALDLAHTLGPGFVDGWQGWGRGGSRSKRVLREGVAPLCLALPVLLFLIFLFTLSIQCPLFSLHLAQYIL